ncbi:nuclear transport factor 2-like protein [Companilactobacillus keshanensis]|uniref:Nuclear transport factor 2 family protein n=1 Tax=Companilactobacillus keshanensis TaxID=2486003 RepID=A0ABW4BW16_9LACO|nr:hypothetical protein [Companilactobacillus keshanensis]
MDKNIETIKKYFELSDLASNDEKALDEIVDLFADDTSIKSGLSETAAGKKKTAEFFKTFFTRNKELKHLFKAEAFVDYYQAEWAVAGLKTDGSLFSLHGFDYYKFNDKGKIISLVVNIS